MKRLISYTLLYLCVVLVAISCKATKIATTSLGQDATPSEGGAYEDQLLFMVFKIYKDSSRMRPIVLISKDQVKGKIKGNDAHAQKVDPSLQIYQIADNGQFLDSIHIQHPLYMHVEHYDEKEIHRTYVELDSAEFFVRLQLSKNTRSIKLVENYIQNQKLLKIIKL